MPDAFECFTEEFRVGRPPGFEPGTRGWKPLVITPSRQALTLAESMASLNGFGRLRKFKSRCLYRGA